MAPLHSNRRWQGGSTAVQNTAFNISNKTGYSPPTLWLRGGEASTLWLPSRREVRARLRCAECFFMQCRHHPKKSSFHGWLRYQ